jgi:hypothetical protein
MAAPIRYILGTTSYIKIFVVLRATATAVKMAAPVRNILDTTSYIKIFVVIRATTTAVQMAAPVRNILDTTSYIKIFVVLRATTTVYTCRHQSGIFWIYLRMFVAQIAPVSNASLCAPLVNDRTVTLFIHNPAR